jgi:hypothetical protein
VILSAGSQVKVTGSRQILILHARVQAMQVVFVIPTSAGGSDSSVYTESQGSLRLKADIRTTFNTVTGLWLRTGESLPLQWSEVPLWVKQMFVTAYKTELSMKKYRFGRICGYQFFQVTIPHVLNMPSFDPCFPFNILTRIMCVGGSAIIGQSNMG